MLVTLMGQRVKIFGSQGLTRRGTYHVKFLQVIYHPLEFLRLSAVC